MRRAGPAIAAAAAAWIAATLALVAVHALAPQRRGLLLISQIFEPYVLLPALIVAPLALIGRRRPGLIIVALLVGVLAVRYGPQMASLPAAAPPEASQFRLLNWNLEVGGVSAEEMIEVIEAHEPDLVGLIELVTRRAVQLEDDPLIQSWYPHRVLPSSDNVRGMGLLSRHPVLEFESWQNPPLIRAVVQPPGEEPIVVYVAHPLLGPIATARRMPIDIAVEPRDRGIRRIRALIDEDLAAGRDVLAMGDFNVTEREPAYTELVRGLRDAHRDAGFGPGFTWRPETLRRLPFGVIRIDYQFASEAFRVLAAATDCTPRGSDHCLVAGVFARVAGGD